MNAAAVTNILLGVLAGAVGFVAFVSSSRANREQAKTAGRAVDAEAYERARESYEAAIATLKGEISLLRDETGRMRVSNDALRESNDNLRTEIHRLREEITNLRTTRGD